MSPRRRSRGRSRGRGRSPGRSGHAGGSSGGGGGGLPEFSATPDASFTRAAQHLRGAPKEIRQELSKAIRTSTQPAVKDLRQAVMAVDSKARAGGGTRQREGHAASRSTSGRPGRGSHGLRASIARAIQTKITYTGYRTGVRIRVDPTRLPEGQKTLPKAINKGKIRHPVWGNPNRWVTQTFSPSGWFDRTMLRHSARVRRELDAAAKRALRQIGG